jgi:hypothetical protein
MKNVLAVVFILVLAGACNKDKNRRSGVCYCEFVKGADQEYDLNNLPRQGQIDQCNTHSNNAANFGGGCELK